MKRIILIVLLFLLTGCTFTSPNQFTEKSVPVNSNPNAYEEVEAIKRINDIKEGATPKVKPTGEDVSGNENKIQPVPPKLNPISQARTNILINEETRNMNIAKISTNKGVIKVKLNPEKAPLSAENFKEYARSGYYNGTIFHRVIPDFMVQGGGFAPDGTQKPTNAPIMNEANNGLNNDRGTIAMARTMVVDSATAQFFINLKDNNFLNYQNEQNYGYAVFGSVIEGLDIVDSIAQVETGNNGPHQDWPVEDIIIEKVELENG